jgi:large subunit ribosomal protein L20
MRSNTFVKANEAVLKSGRYSYRDRKAKKRNFRQLWIVRLNAALAVHGVGYAPFIKALHTKKIALDRKALSELAIHEPEAFAAVVKAATK